jgi:YVTN family beta-propeller protein
MRQSLALARRVAALLVALALTAASSAAQGYRVAATHVIGGDGGWDYVALDTVGHRLFIARNDRVLVVDEASGKIVGEIPGFKRAHGIAFDYAARRGFATSGEDSSVVVFNLENLAVIKRTHADDDADAILFDPATKHVFTMNGDAGTSSVIDPATGARIANIPLGGKPEFGVSDGHGHVYANLEDKSEIAEIDAAAKTVVRHWSIAPCESPTGLAIDVEHHRLFSGCRNKMIAVSDASAGKLVTTVAAGSGIDANRFDSGTQLAFSSNGDGSITVVHEDSPSSFRVIQTVTTMPGARTMELDGKTHRLYTVTAKMGPRPAAPTKDNSRRRPPVLPGTFSLIVLER